MSRAAWAWTAAALLATGGGGYAWVHRCGGDAPDTEKARTAAARTGVLRQTVREIGTLQPAVKVEVKPEISGRVSRLLVDVGDIVKAGQILVQLDDRILLNQREQARIKLEQARLTEDKQQRTLERKSRLSDGEKALIAQEELDQARTDHALAVAGRRDAENTVKDVENQLQHTAIASPLDGRVIERGVSVGDVVIGSASAGAPTTLVTVANTGRMLAVVEVNEADYPKVAVDQPVELRPAAQPGRVFGGKVVTVGLSGHADAKNKNLVTYTVQAEVADASSALQAGMTATVDIITCTKGKALILPREAVGRRDGKPFAVRVKGGVEEPVDLKTGVESENEVEVLSGVSEGEEVRLGAWTEADWEAYHKAQQERRDTGSGRRRVRGHL